MILTYLLLIFVHQAICGDITYNCYESAISGNLSCFNEDTPEGKYPLVVSTFKGYCNMHWADPAKISFFYTESGRRPTCKVSKMCSFIPFSNSNIYIY